MTKKILCVGIYGHEITYLLGALIRKSLSEKTDDREKFFIKCVGFEEESDREYPPHESFHTVMNQLGFYPSRSPNNPSIISEATRRELTPIHYRPTSISSAKNIHSFDIFVTPYAWVFQELKSKEYTFGKDVLLASPPNGIGLKTPTPMAVEMMQSWVQNHFGNRD